MQYLYCIRVAICIFPLIAVLLYIPCIVFQYIKYKKLNLFKILIFYSFILYLIILYFLVILPLPTFEEAIKMSIKGNLYPFHFIQSIMSESSFNILDFNTYFKSLFEPCIYTVLLNILMMIPLGIYLRGYFKLNFGKTITITFILSLFFELTQLSRLYFIYPKPYRVFDVDDVLMNTLGGILGYLIINRIINKAK